MLPLGPDVFLVVLEGLANSPFSRSNKSYIFSSSVFLILVLVLS